MALCGIDPSFRRTGLAIYSNGKIYIRNCRTEPNKDKSFQQVWYDARQQVVRIKKALKEYSDRYECILSECPPPQGMFSPGLYALDTLLISILVNMTDEVRVVYPNYIGHVHGKRNYQKSESVSLAKEMLDRLPLDVDSNSRISHDESEAVIFLMRLFVFKGMYLEELGEFKGLFSDKDKMIRS